MCACEHNVHACVHARARAHACGIGRTRKCSNSCLSFTQKHRNRSNIMYYNYCINTSARTRVRSRFYIIHTFLLLLKTFLPNARRTHDARARTRAHACTRARGYTRAYTNTCTPYYMRVHTLVHMCNSIIKCLCEKRLV